MFRCYSCFNHQPVCAASAASCLLLPSAVRMSLTLSCHSVYLSAIGVVSSTVVPLPFLENIFSVQKCIVGTPWYYFLWAISYKSSLNKIKKSKYL